MSVWVSGRPREAGILPSAALRRRRRLSPALTPGIWQIGVNTFAVSAARRGPRACPGCGALFLPLFLFSIFSLSLVFLSFVISFDLGDAVRAEVDLSPFRRCLVKRGASPEHPGRAERSKEPALGVYE